jgi:Ca-activated chloride channel family protein
VRPALDHPLLLALAVLLPIAVIALVVAGYRRRRRRLERLGTPTMINRLVPPNAAVPPGWRATRLALAAALAGIAIAGPRWGIERTVVRGEGVDIVLAVDASLSMMATDERPNRLEKVKQEIRRLRAASPSDRFALLAFAGRSYILTPLTVDDAALDLFLDNLDPSVVGQAGSSLARAIRQGTDLLVATKGGSDRAVVIFSDGEAFEPPEDVVEASKAAGEAGVSIVTVGFGTVAGATIPVREGNAVVEKRDPEGNIVVTKYHPEMLRVAAEAANGTFIDAGESDKAAKVRRALVQLRGVQRAVEAGRTQTPRFQLFLIPAVLLLLLDTALAERRGRRRRSAAAAATAASVLLAAAMSFVPIRAARADDVRDAAREYAAKRYMRAAALYRRALERGDKRPEVLYNLGTSLLAADSLASAIEVLERAAKASDPDVKFRSMFNLGLAHLKRGLAAKGDSATPSLDAALETYKRALLMRSRDGDAKWNYELAFRNMPLMWGGGGGGGGVGGGGGGSQNQPSPPRQPQSERPSGGLGNQQAEQLLNSAEREERNVQARKQQQNRPQPPPGGKDW